MSLVGAGICAASRHSELKVEQPQKRIPLNTAMTADTGFISMGWKSAPQIEPVKFSDEERTWRSNASVACAFDRTLVS
jgi:hypothetical protein